MAEMFCKMIWEVKFDQMKFWKYFSIYYKCAVDNLSITSTFSHLKAISNWNIIIFKMRITDISDFKEALRNYCFAIIINYFKYDCQEILENSKVLSQKHNCRSHFHWKDESEPKVDTPLGSFMICFDTLRWILVGNNDNDAELG